MREGIGSCMREGLWLDIQYVYASGDRVSIFCNQ